MPPTSVPARLMIQDDHESIGNRSRSGTLTFTLDGMLPSDILSDCGSQYDYEKEPLLHSNATINGKGDQEEANNVEVWVGPVLFLCGISIFARTEAIFLQQLFYGGCLGFGDTFYTAGTAALFVPGIVVHVLQSRYDSTWNRKYGLKATIIVRLAVCTFVSIAVLIAIIGAANYSSTFPNYYLLYGLLTIVGFSTSVAFGTFTRLISLFPSSLQSWFFVGTFCPFLVFAPVNIGTGDICMPDSFSMAGFDTRWSAVWIFYGVAVGVVLLGFGACLCLLFSNVGAHYVGLGDGQLRCEESEHLNKTITLWQMLKIQVIPSVAMGLGTLASTLAAAFYICFRVTHYKDLSTLLIYEYYICASFGIMLSSWQPVVNLFGDKAILAMSLIRAPCAALAVYYARFPDIYHNDYMVLGINGAFMVTGGIIYTRSFGQISRTFTNVDDRMTAASLMSAMYYFAIILGISISFGLHLTLPKAMHHS